MRFEWDEKKDIANKRKHRVTFLEAQSVFFDERAILFDDPGHSGVEVRFLLLGLSMSFRGLVVVHCLREDGDVIRIISARKATLRECKAYPGGGP